MAEDERELDRLSEAKRLFDMFRPERYVHLSLCGVAFVLVLCAAGLILKNREAKATELSLIFGSGGLVTYTSNRLLVMWTDMVRIVFGK